VGIKPDVEVHTTIEDLRNGKDPPGEGTGIGFKTLTPSAHSSGAVYAHLDWASVTDGAVL
jgi:hypothetical protein